MPDGDAVPVDAAAASPSSAWAEGPDAGDRCLPGWPSSASVAASSANLGPGFDSLGLALGLYDEILVETTDAGLSSRSRARAPGRCPPTRRTWWSAPSHRPGRFDGRRAGRAAACCCAAATPSRTAADSARRPRPSSAALARRAAWSGTADQSSTPAQLIQLSTEFEGHPDNAPPRVLGGAVVVVDRRPDGAGRPAPPRRCACTPTSTCSRDPGRRVLDRRDPRCCCPARCHVAAAFNVSRAALLVVRAHRAAGPADGGHRGRAAPAAAGRGDARLGWYLSRCCAVVAYQRCSPAPARRCWRSRSSDCRPRRWSRGMVESVHRPRDARRRRCPCPSRCRARLSYRRPGSRVGPRALSSVPSGNRSVCTCADTRCYLFARMRSVD